MGYIWVYGWDIGGIYMSVWVGGVGGIYISGRCGWEVWVGGVGGRVVSFYGHVSF